MHALHHRAVERTRIVVADDFPDMFDAVEKCLAPDCEVMERVCDGLALVECVCRLKPDLLVTDISMPKLNGIEALRQLRSLGVHTPAIVLTIYDDQDLAKEAFAAGARAFVHKARLGSDLRLAFREVLAGRTYTSEIAHRKFSNRSNQANFQCDTKADTPAGEILLNHSGLLISRTESMTWEAGRASGCWAKTLFVEGQDRVTTSLMRMDAGTRFPKHRHLCPEEVFLLAGDLVVESQIMRPGDYSRAEANSIHSESYSKGGCLFILRTSQLDEIVE